ncbi:MAG: hotdog fold thioesterase [Ginsengibacter sp.]
MMSIWFNKSLATENINAFGKETMAAYLGIQLVEIGDDFLKLSMPVDERTRQPFGVLHGGASCVLAETIGSFASALVIDLDKYICMGLDINANHVRSAKSGLVIANCTPLHLGKTTHVWDIKIYNEDEKLVCISRLTVAILEKR